MERLKERLGEAERALATLLELLIVPDRSAVQRDAAILRFAYTFEAVWKTAQRHLAAREGIDAGSPKQCIRASRRVGLLTDEEAEAALRMADDRNLVVHIYHEALARHIHARLPGHATALGAWLRGMQQRPDDDTVSRR
ncbi:MAG: nucleotidyltransferase substrate binding protein [Candidatus Rokuibacteriota bacterium]